MNELKQLEAQRDDEIEIDLGEIFHLLLNKLWVIILSFIDDLYFNEDNQCDISCRYPDGIAAYS